jgi:hypothetical protein
LVVRWPAPLGFGAPIGRLAFPEIGVPGGALLQVFEGFAEEAGGAAGAIVDAFADAGLDDLNDRADERARRVVFAAIAPGIAHVADLGFVEVGEFVLFGLRAEVQLVDMVDDFAQVVAALNLVFDLAEDFADFVFDGIGTGGALLEAVEVGEELGVDEIAEVVSGERFVVVELAGLVFGRRPGFPAIGFFEKEGVFLSVEFGFGATVLLEAVEILEEQEPGGLLGVVEFGGAAGFLAEDVIDVSEGLFEHSFSRTAP